jgi:hypothetical protein
MKHTGRPQTKREREREQREMARTLRRLDRDKLTKLKAALRAARQARRAALAAAVEFCREGRAQVRARARERRMRALAELKAARLTETIAARDACLAKKMLVRETAARPMADAAKALAEARTTRTVSARVERENQARAKERRGRTRAEASENDDAVRANLPAELVPVFDRVRRRIKATPRMSRTEVFLHWAEENPGEVLAAQGDAADRAVAELVKEHAEQERLLRSEKRYRRKAAELAKDLAKEDEEAPF